ncbi:MAG: glutamate---cysteine ligase / carboxylate-amine ligase [Nocardioidaceae bacterium]|nr:glutamate---cysteine ligase / carboxylate-amine ligase [Nocardioidaceae bacterium]
MGVEEELLLVDPESGALRALASAALTAHRQRVGAVAEDSGFGAESGMEEELFRQQVETGTAPCRTAEELGRDLASCRREAAGSAAQAGAALVAVGTPVLPKGDEEQVTAKDRYERIVNEFGEISRQGSVCGMHVHVDVADDDEGVRVIDGLRPWLPVLRAISVNSPYWRGMDTGYASWRSVVWGRWPTAGPSDLFRDPAGYRAASEALVRSGAALDLGMLYFDARMSISYPTVEVRVFDVTTELDDVVLLALLTRALVSTIASASSQGSAPVGEWRLEMLRAAHWRASRDGVAGELLDPRDGDRRPARTVVEALIEYVRPALEETGDVAPVADRLERLLARGTGASRQRAAFERGGLDEVVADLRRRFEASYR